MNTSLTVRDPFYSIFAVAAVTVMSIAAFTPAGSEPQQVASQAIGVVPLESAVQSAVSLSPRVTTLATAAAMEVSSAN